MNLNISSKCLVEGGGAALLRVPKIAPSSVPRKPPMHWPALDDLRMTESELNSRRSSIGGSDANVIFSGDPEKILKLWAEKRGEAEPADLSDRIAVLLGCWTEPFNRQWFERMSGQMVTRVGQVLTSTEHPWRTCTLDGLVAETEAVWEAKHTSAFSNAEDVLARYMPQLQHNMAVAGKNRAILSVIFGNHKFEVIEVASDWLYQIELLEAEAEFWNCVQTGQVPVAAAPPARPKAIAVREVCLEGNNAWASAAFDWLEHRDAAKAHAAATTTIKQLVEEDAKRAFGHGIEAKRSKSGAITIKELA